MNQVKSYRDLEAWQTAMDLTVEVYSLTRMLPDDEKFGLSSQARRAAASIPANIAEGQGRRTTGELLQFLSISRGSLTELKTHLELTVRLEYLTKDQIHQAWTTAETTGKLINGLIRALEPRKRLRNPSPPANHQPPITNHQNPTTNH